MTDEKIRLNPFVYISETDIAFYSLVLIGIIIPALYVQIIGIAVYFVIIHEYLKQDINSSITILFLFMLFFIIPGVIYFNYRRFPMKIIKENKLKEFDRNKFPEQYRLIEDLNNKYLKDSILSKLDGKSKNIFLKIFDTVSLLSGCISQYL